MKRLILFAAITMITFSAVAQKPAAPGQPTTGLVPKAAASACALPPRTTPFTFWQSCDNVRMNGCTLEARCQQKNRNVHDATFDMTIFPSCYSDPLGGRNMYNADGKLCCGYAGKPIICGT